MWSETFTPVICALQGGEAHCYTYSYFAEVEVFISEFKTTLQRKIKVEKQSKMLLHLYKPYP